MLVKGCDVKIGRIRGGGLDRPTEFEIRSGPDFSCGVEFGDDEWETFRSSNRKEKKPPKEVASAQYSSPTNDVIPRFALTNSPTKCSPSTADTAASTTHPSQAHSSLSRASWHGSSGLFIYSHRR